MLSNWPKVIWLLRVRALMRSRCSDLECVCWAHGALDTSLGEGVVCGLQTF